MESVYMVPTFPSSLSIGVGNMKVSISTPSQVILFFLHSHDMI